MPATSRSKDIQQFIVANVSNHPRDILAQTATHFHISKQAAHLHMQKLMRVGIVTKLGKTSGSRYILSDAAGTQFAYTLRPTLSDTTGWEEHIKSRLQGTVENVYRICEYGFTEMFNNAIDHSEGSKITGEFHIQDRIITMIIRDNGVGIFAKIQKELGLDSLRESVLHLSKGKFTTDSTRHSGEGIFFSSRAFDKFSILSSQLVFIRFGDDDWMLCEEKESRKAGTSIFMKIAIDASQNLRDIFDTYSTPDEIGFHKTIVAVHLSKHEHESHISRSQARRLLFGLNTFKEIVLDFKDVNTVGQAFVDEVFRVFANSHPHILIRYINASSDVEFMLKRSIGGIHPNQATLGS